MKAKLFNVKTVIIALACTFAINKSEAQLKDFLNKAKSKGKSLFSTAKPDSATASPADKQTAKAVSAKVISDSAVSDFQTGDSILLNEVFASDAVGSLPKSFKTNGAGKIITIPDTGGKWLQLENGSTYKFSKLVNLPAKFSIEFDIIAIADQTTDLDPLIFGFAVNNSVTKYIQDAYNNGGICTVSLLYFNKNEIVVSSSQTGNYLSTSFNLAAYGNRTMHVSILGNNNQLAVYLDKTKIVDSELFKNSPSKYPFISAPLNSKNNAHIAIGNISVKTFTKAN